MLPGRQGGQCVDLDAFQTEPSAFSASSAPAGPSVLSTVDMAERSAAAAAGIFLPLTRARVVQAAIAVIDTYGSAGLTMRRVGDYLGVEAMALYHYVAGRDDLLDGVVATVVEDLAAVPVAAESRDWPGYLRRIAHGVRRLALAHPAVFPLMITRPCGASWLRAPLRDPAWAASFLSTLRGCGFSDSASGDAYRAFTSFLTGHLLLEAVSRQPDPTRPAVAMRPKVGTARSERAPTPQGVGEPTRGGDATPADACVGPDSPDTEFDNVLTALTERLALSIVSGGPASETPLNDG